MLTVKKKNSDDEEASICDYCLKATSSASFSEGLLTCKECKATGTFAVTDILLA